MRWSLLLFALAACADESAITIDDSRTVSSIDVVVSETQVIVYPRGDLSCQIFGNEERVFPALGECVVLSDATGLSCQTSTVIETCFEEVSVDGKVPSIGAPTDLTRPFAIGVTVNASSTLTLRGCGLDLELPLVTTTRPTPTLETTIDADNHVTSMWTTDVPNESTLVQMTSGFGGEACRTAGDSYTFANQPSQVQGITNIRVQPLLAPVTRVEGATTIRVWAGNVATALFRRRRIQHSRRCPRRQWSSCV